MPETEFRLRRVDGIALVTIENDDSSRPATFTRGALVSLRRVLDEIEAHECSGLVITGVDDVFAAGADIDEFPNATPEFAREASRAGHELFLRIRALPFPTLAAINGTCLGGGVELALHCDYRTIAADVRRFACPEVFLGIFPAWGGTQLVPRLVGGANAVRFIVTNPLRQNRMLTAGDALELAFVDAVLEREAFLDESLAFLREREKPTRGDVDLSDTEEAVRRARADVPNGALAPQVALDLIAGAAQWSLEEGYRAEEDALAELLPGPQAQNSIYAFNLVERRQKRGIGVPNVSARSVTRVGVVGAGLMATQIATLFVRRLEIPLVIRDIADEIVERSLREIRGELAARKPELAELAEGTTAWDGFDECDFVLEAVVERLDVKQEIFATLREIAPRAVLATNTSALSVAEIGADVGMHFFNPVAVLPLVEIVRHDDTPDDALATAWEVTNRLRKRGVVVRDAPGFVVNRLLTRMTSVLMDALEHGNTVDETDEAVLRLGFPMAPSVLLQLVGPRVANHVLETMHEAWPDRFPLSPTLASFAAGNDEIVVAQHRPRSVDELTDAVLEALADEIRHLLADGVVDALADVDTCLLLGAGWPFWLGGITPYLQQRGLLEPAHA